MTAPDSDGEPDAATEGGRARRAFLGLGSNLGDRRRYLAEAVASIPDVVAVSPVYESEALGGPPDQGPYLNIVVELSTDLSPRDLLGVCHRLETAAERVRIERWGARTLDVDILWVEGLTVAEDDLDIPHPRMWERDFVLLPLRDLAPELIPPGWHPHERGPVRVGTLPRT